MASKKRNRTRRATRGATRNPDPWILVVTEGKVTELSYLKGLKAVLRRSFDIPSIPSEHGDPLTLVENAKRMRIQMQSDARRLGDPKHKLDEVWCVFDRDEHDHARVAQAIDNARASEINVAFSNPCFELWLLLHFREQPGDQHRHHIQALAGNYVPGFDKYVPPEVVSDAARIDAAIRRARVLSEQAEEEGDPYRSPTTGVFKLVCSLLKYSSSRSASAEELHFIASASMSCKGLDRQGDIH